MKRIIKYPAIVIAGGVLYCVIEILWRGYTHWTMAVAGGVSLLGIYCIRDSCPDVPLFMRCLTGSAVICAVEFATGFAVNIVLGWNVWDYSNRWMNLCGQICPRYAVYWFLLCIPANFILEKIDKLSVRPDHVAEDPAKRGATYE